MEEGEIREVFNILREGLEQESAQLKQRKGKLELQIISLKRNLEQKRCSSPCSTSPPFTSRQETVREYSS